VQCGGVPVLNAPVLSVSSLNGVYYDIANNVLETIDFEKFKERKLQNILLYVMDAKFRDVKFRDVKLRDVKFRDVRFRDENFRDVKFRDVSS
jgi:uncharacterized protein YjbI with pentapeptide repeats